VWQRTTSHKCIDGTAPASADTAPAPGSAARGEPVSLRLACAGLPSRGDGYSARMSEQFSDPQLTGDDPMMGQIEALAHKEGKEGGRPPAEGASPTHDPLEPGEPESARFEPDASQ
jgi:hypothetical protein